MVSPIGTDSYTRYAASCRVILRRKGTYIVAIYHLHASVVSRSAGSSAVATASYITGLSLRDERTGELYNYGRKQRVSDYGVILPNGASDELREPGALMNSAEASERAKNAAVAKKIEVALPIELSFEEQRNLVNEFILETFTARRYPCVWALHTNADGTNPHAHVEIVNRPMKPDGSWGAKTTSTYRLDAEGNRIPEIDKRTGKQRLGARNAKLWQREKHTHWLGTKEFVPDVRIAWETTANRALERAGADNRIDHRTLAAQGIERVPQLHEGYGAQRMAAEGQASDRVEYNAAVRDRSDAAAELDVIRSEIENAREVRRIYEYLDERLETIHRREDRGDQSGNRTGAVRKHKNAGVRREIIRAGIAGAADRCKQAATVITKIERKSAAHMERASAPEGRSTEAGRDCTKCMRRDRGFEKLIRSAERSVAQTNIGSDRDEHDAALSVGQRAIDAATAVQSALRDYTEHEAKRTKTVQTVAARGDSAESDIIRGQSTTGVAPATRKPATSVAPQKRPARKPAATAAQMARKSTVTAAVQKSTRGESIENAKQWIKKRFDEIRDGLRGIVEKIAAGYHDAVDAANRIINRSTDCGDGPSERGRETGGRSGEASGRSGETGGDSRVELAAAILHTLTNHGPDERQVSKPAHRVSNVSGGATVAAAPAAPQYIPTPAHERRAIVDQAQRRMSSMSVMAFLERCGVSVKSVKVKTDQGRVSGYCLDVPGVKRSQRPQIVISADGTQWSSWSGGVRQPGGGGVVEAATAFVPDYAVRNSDYDAVILRLARALCPDTIKNYDRRPMTQAEVSAYQQRRHEQEPQQQRTPKRPKYRPMQRPRSRGDER